MAQMLGPSEGLSYEDCVSRALEGKKHSAGLVELFLFKKEALGYLCGSWLDGLGIRSGVKKQVRDKCSCVKSFREACGYSFDTNFPKVSFSWRVGWSRAEEKALELIEVCHVGLLRVYRNYVIALRIPSGHRSLVCPACIHIPC